MRSNAVGGRLLNSSLSWDGAVMMPLHYTTIVAEVYSPPSHWRQGPVRGTIWRFSSFVLWFEMVPSLLGTGYKLIETVYGEEKNILYWADIKQPRQDKISCTGMTSPTNQQRKDLYRWTSWVGGGRSRGEGRSRWRPHLQLVRALLRPCFKRFRTILLLLWAFIRLEPLD